MAVSTKILLSIFLSTVFVSAAPNSNAQLKPRVFNCADSPAKAKFGQNGPIASAFCSKYLAKTTTTTTTKTITPESVTATTNVPATGYTYVTITSTQPGDPITYYYNAPYPSNTKTILPTPPAKRDLEVRNSIPIPSFAAGYSGDVISSACSCLSVKPSTTTKTRTTTTVTLYTTVATVASTVTTTVTGPRPTVSTCYDYQNSPLNAGYEYLNMNDTNHLVKLTNVPIFSNNLIECCNLCYQTPDCVVYRFNNDHSTPTCERWTTPSDGQLPIIGYNEQCRSGLVDGTRQPITETNLFGRPAGAIAIGPCLNANYRN